LSLLSAQPSEYSTHWENYYFYVFYGIAKLYDFITEPTICWQYVLDVLSSDDVDEMMHEWKVWFELIERVLLPVGVEIIIVWSV
jgi:hypothetical protein